MYFLSFLKFKNLIAIIICSLFIVNCGEAKPEANPEYVNEIDSWHKWRIENLKKPTGWLNLVGLHWLKEGENKFGSDPSNGIVFPKEKADPFLGSFILKEGKVIIKVNDDVEIKNEDTKVTEMLLQTDAEENTTILTHKTLAWFIIVREDKIGVRVRDFEAPLLAEFEGVERFPVDENWKVEAKFVPYDPPKQIIIPSIIGTKSETECKGKLEFVVEGKTYSLDPIGTGDLFIVFADETNGVDTYGAGRFLVVAEPDSTGKTFIDFNKAYNPPCAFTKFATCPLPPKDNYLHLKVTAGEKKYGDGHH